MYVNPILLVPPTKVVNMTMSILITDPLKHLGEGISKFLKASLKPLPVTLHFPMLPVFALAIVACHFEWFRVFSGKWL
ncbi:hypothetical protein HF521_022647 [Silurus meridionalis]|uniref:Chloride channel CLIC-like protein 1 n=1 Tax=Silurus meridionalis TaxID=175797 RepID=A0A8T0BEJ1_SILME|nr:hypothetical protein HF521_022647 [Silurus meridionalis]